jgi:hypothetical protein
MERVAWLSVSTRKKRDRGLPRGKGGSPSPLAGVQGVGWPQGFPPVAPTDPGVRNYRTRLLATRFRYARLPRTRWLRMALASFAIRSSFVETTFEPGVSAIFPPNRSVSRHPLSSTGSLGTVPLRHSFYGVLRLLITIHVASFPSLRCTARRLRR